MRRWSAVLHLIVKGSDRATIAALQDFSVADIISVTFELICDIFLPRVIRGGTRVAVNIERGSTDLRARNVSLPEAS